MENLKTKNWYWFLIKGIIMILLAFLVFSSPGSTLVAVALYLGIGFLVAGILLIYMGFSERKIFPNWGWRVFEGFLDLFLGFMFLTYPVASAAAIPFMIGFWAAFYGFMLFLDAFSGNGNGLLKAVSGILIVILSLVIMFNPVFVGLTIMVWFGILLLIGGIYNVILSFSLK